MWKDDTIYGRLVIESKISKYEKSIASTGEYLRSNSYPNI